MFLGILEVLILIVIFGILFYICYGVYKENQIPFVENSKEIVEVKRVSTENDMSQKQKTKETKEKINLPEEYLGFPISARLEIPKIKLVSYVLNEYSVEGMKVCLSKYWGPEPNEIGNFCIAGHNYENDAHMFCHLIDLKIGDTIYLSDRKNGKCTYTIYDIYKVKPENTAPLRQETGDKKVITLVTCVNYSRNRLIVQAIASEE